MKPTEATGQETSFDSEDEDSVLPRRMYLHEPGWRIGVKTGSHREFCYTMAPGEDFYHRLLDGEIFLFRTGERLCLSCASRRGLISLEPKQLREGIVSVPARSSRPSLWNWIGAMLIARTDDRLRFGAIRQKTPRSRPKRTSLIARIGSLSS